MGEEGEWNGWRLGQMGEVVIGRRELGTAGQRGERWLHEEKESRVGEEECSYGRRGSQAKGGERGGEGGWMRRRLAPTDNTNDTARGAIA